MSNSATPLHVGAILFDGFELLDLYGPLEIFSLLEPKPVIRLLSEKTGPVASHAGPVSLADLALTEPLPLDILLIPGGQGTRALVHNVRFLDQLLALFRRAKYVLSVCTGSALLAKAGLLDGKQATSNKMAFAWVTQQGPRVHWVPRARWVRDGNIFTSSGISAGTDMAVAVLDHLYGTAVAQQVCQRAEYLWHHVPQDDPFCSEALLQINRTGSLPDTEA